MKDTCNTDDLIKQLEKRKISFNDEEIKDAQKFFIFNSYYRFSGYTYIFENFVRGGARTHKYPDGLTFSEVKNIYLFDKKLRLIILEALEECEVAIKTIICNELSSENGSNFLSKEDNFKYGKYDRVSSICNKAVSSNQHLSYVKGQEFFNLESWKLFEIMTLGQVVNIYNLLKQPPYNALIDNFKLEFNKRPQQSNREYNNMKKEKLDSVLRSLKILRNHCAHHNRLIGYTFKSVPPLITTSSNNTFKVARHIHILNTILNSMRPDNRWKYRIDKLIIEYGQKLKKYDKVGTKDNYHYKCNQEENGIDFIKMMMGYESDE